MMCLLFLKLPLRGVEISFKLHTIFKQFRERCLQLNIFEKTWEIVDVSQMPSMHTIRKRGCVGDVKKSTGVEKPL